MNIVLIGFGWLGKQLAGVLTERDHKLFVSYRRDEMRSEISALGAEPFYADLVREIALPEVAKEADICIITVPPFDRSNLTNYGNALQAVAAPFGPKTKFIFTSSTSVYPQRSGLFDENYVFTPAEQQNVIYQAELHLQANWKDRLCVLRLGGLIGPARHPVFSLSGRVIPTDGSCPVCLAPSTLVAALILELIESRFYAGVLNVGAPTRMTKKSYYTEMATRFGKDAPIYGTLEEPKRTIDLRKMQATFPNLNQSDLENDKDC